MSLDKKRGEIMDREVFNGFFPNMKNIDDIDRAVLLIPEQVLKCPSAISGKYHPIDEHGDLGIIRHTQRGFIVLESVYKPSFKGQEELYRDMEIAWAFHDTMKPGEYSMMLPFETPRAPHAVAAAKRYKNVLSERVCRIILTHGGPFYKNIPEPNTLAEKVIHWVDMTVSRSMIYIDYTGNLNIANTDITSMLGYKRFKRIKD